MLAQQLDCRSIIAPKNQMQPHCIYTMVPVLGGQMRRCHSLFASFLGLLVLTPSRANAQLADGCTALGSALVDHSCFHATFGPFNSVQATHGSEATEDTANVDPVHTEHRVGLPAAGGTHVVTYSPERTGAWIVFSDRAVPFTVRDAEGDALTTVLEQRGDTGCDALPLARVYELEARTRYSLQIGATDAPSIVLVIEYGNDFLTPSGLDADGDGYGGQDGAVVTNCQPAAGRAPNATDCNDSDPSIHPGAAELCDEVDRNCNGSTTDEGLQCRAGTGSCVVVGTFSCKDGDEPRCSAERATATAEQCNGLDDDCDGVIDNAEGLCPEMNAPSCVRVDFEAFCGCLLDQDCGTRDSGRVCDADVRLCVDGCRVDLSGNLCPNHMRCTTTSEAPFGECAVPPEASALAHRSDGGADEDVGEAHDRGTTGGAHPVENDAPSSAGCYCELRPRELPSSWMVGSLVLGFAALRRIGRGAKGRRKSQLKHHPPGRIACAGLLLLCSSSGCGGRVSLTSRNDPSPPARAPAPTRGNIQVQADAGCEWQLGDKPAQHSCSHAINGTFEDLAASADPASAPAADTIHVTYMVAPTAGSTQSYLEYTPTRNGEHVIFTDQTATLQFLGDGGAPLVPLFAGSVAGCRALKYGVAVELVEGRTYTLSLSNVSAPPLLVFFEHLATFGEQAWAVRCSP